MTTIWKFVLENKDRQTIRLPKKHKFLDVQLQKGITCLWALVDTNTEWEEKAILIVGTGNPCPAFMGPYIGTYQLMNGELVFHVFEEA